MTMTASVAGAAGCPLIVTKPDCAYAASTVCALVADWPLACWVRMTGAAGGFRPPRLVIRYARAG